MNPHEKLQHEIAYAVEKSQACFEAIEQNLVFLYSCLEKRKDEIAQELAALEEEGKK